MEEQDVPDVDAQDAACPYTAAVSVAEGMSEEALAQWIDSFPADGRPEGAAPPHQPQDKSIVSSAFPCPLSGVHLRLSSRTCCFHYCQRGREHLQMKLAVCRDLKSK